MDTTMKECLLYLPLYDEIAGLEIGTDEGALLEAAPDPFRHRIVVIGSSITHGTSASRPGMAYAARLGRTLGFGFITPLIFLQTEVRESGNFDLKKRAFEDAKREAARKGMEKILETDKNIWFINPGMELGDDHEATVDGVHPTDLGFERMLKKVQPQIIRILQKHGIK